jgi:Zn finger protein HypA/HybF involved in hydrogenase expression
MSKLFEKIARSAGAGLAEKLNQTAEEEYYQFECEQEHEFGIKVKLPQSIYELTEMFREITCPLCRSKNIKVKKTL